ncbi:hypothetical protein ACTXNW_14215 [Enterococcus malodoratus]|uniref:hypothetical protein n=1 Tax=Enterococcus malodoratus TaxID=71451 RepID=UPI003FD4C074
MKKKQLRVPIKYLQNNDWKEYGKIETSTITTVSENSYFNSGDIGYSVFFHDSVNKEAFLFDEDFYLINAPTDPNFSSYMMRLSIEEDRYIFSPTSTFNNIKPVTLFKNDTLINDVILGKLLFTFHDFDNSIEFVESEE